MCKSKLWVKLFVGREEIGVREWSTFDDVDKWDKGIERTQLDFETIKLRVKYLIINIRLRKQRSVDL